jgi:hypothetical protein
VRGEKMKEKEGAGKKWTTGLYPPDEPELGQG